MWKYPVRSVKGRKGMQHGWLLLFGDKIDPKGYILRAYQSMQIMGRSEWRGDLCMWYVCPIERSWWPLPMWAPVKGGTRNNETDTLEPLVNPCKKERRGPREEEKGKSRVLRGHKLASWLCFQEMVVNAFMLLFTVLFSCTAVVLSQVTYFFLFMCESAGSHSWSLAMLHFVLESLCSRQNSLTAFLK